MPFSNRCRVRKAHLALFFSLLFLVFASRAQASPKLQMAPLNPAFLAYMEQLEQRESRGADESRTGGLIPSPIDWARIGEARVGESFWEKTRAADVLPASFDLVAAGRVTPVLDQGMWGTCWSFAATESVESSLLSEGKGTYDLSELHLAYYAYVDESADKPAFTVTAKENENPIFDNGGFPFQVPALYARGTGPVSEVDAPYPYDWPNDPSLWAAYRPSSAPTGRVAFRLRDALRFTSPDDVRRAVMDIGGLVFLLAGDGKYRDDKNGNIYTHKPTAPNHAVMLVGWDDDYPKEVFVRSDDKGGNVMPSSDGAWKIQNSWGEKAGDKGYYWVSYEDGSIFSPQGTWGYRMDPADVYDGIYSHDPLGACNFVFDDSDYEIDEPRVEMANIFTARRNEKIVSVNFVTLNSDIDYEIQVYKNLEGDSPDTGTPVWSAPQRGTAAAVGYHAINIANPALISKGERFAVSVTLIENDKNLHIPIEVAIKGYSDKATALPGESFIKVDADGWEDTADDEDDAFNLCVKAYTVAADVPDTEGSSSSSGCASGVAGAALLALVCVVVKRRRI